jgi:hypothetical protein
VYDAQSVFVALKDEAWVVAVAVANDCCASGIVNVKEEACWESRNRHVCSPGPAMPVEVVTVPANRSGLCERLTSWFSSHRLLAA